WYDRDEQICNDQPVAETPKQPRPPPSGEAKQNINSSENGKKPEEAGKSAAEAEKGANRSANNQQDCQQVNPREAAPSVSKVRRQSSHRQSGRNTTLPEEPLQAEGKRSPGRTLGCPELSRDGAQALTRRIRHSESARPNLFLTNLCRRGTLAAG